MWVSGMFAWIELVQSNPAYSDNLQRIVDGKMGREDFIDVVSDILDSNEKDKMRRRSNFELAMNAVGYMP